MGIYDNVNYKMDCPICGKDVGNFQTKDCGGWFETIEYWECDHFYSSCDYCNAWIEFILKRERVPIPLSAYEMRVELSKCDEGQFIRDDSDKIVSIRGKE